MQQGSVGHDPHRLLGRDQIDRRAVDLGRVAEQPGHFGDEVREVESRAAQLDAPREGHELGGELGEALDLAAQLGDHALAASRGRSRAGRRCRASGAQRGRAADHQIEAHGEAIERVLHLVRDGVGGLAEQAQALLAHGVLLALAEDLERSPEQQQQQQRRHEGKREPGDEPVAQTRVRGAEEVVLAAD